MSRFYGTFNSDCTKQSSKRGHTYIDAHIRGWSIGIKVIVEPCSVCGADCITYGITGGSTNPTMEGDVHTLCSADCQK